MLARLFFLMAILMLPGRLAAQLIFQNLKGQDGLSEKQVRCLYRDADGFLWIGTPNGLNRFDGAVIRQYQHEKGLKNLYINAIQPLKDEQKLLIGTREGIRIFDKNSGHFKNDARFGLLNNIAVETIRPDDRGRFWIATTVGVYIFSKNKLHPAAEIIPAMRIIDNPQYYSSGFVWDRFRKGFWIGGLETYFVDCTNNRVYHKLYNPKKLPVLDAAMVEAIAPDMHGNIWYGSNSDLTLRFWNAATGKETRYDKLAGKRINDGYNYIFIDSRERVWISTWTFAAYVYEPGKTIQKIPFSQNQNYSIAYGHFRDAIEDEEGNVWLGTINGVSKSPRHSPISAIYRLPSFDFFLETGFSHANSVQVDGDKMIACKEDGVLVYSIGEGTSRRYVVTEGPDYVRNKFMAATKAGNNWWFAGADGIFRLDQRTDRLVKLTYNDTGNPSTMAELILTDKDENIWFHLKNGPLYRHNPKTGRTDRFDGAADKWGQFAFATIQAGRTLHDGNPLFACQNAGFMTFNIPEKRFSTVRVRNIDNFTVSCLAEDRNGYVWAAVPGSGLLQFHTSGTCMDSLNTSNGLRMDQFASIDITDSGIIWAAGREGLESINPRTREETRVQLNMGKNLEDYWNYLTIVRGKIYAVMLDHVVVIDPSQFLATPVRRPPLITSVRVFQNDKNFRENEELQLDANEDYVTFQFASLQHRDVPSLQYSYQLEGVDKNWVNAGRFLSASYNKLRYGHYIFKVRSTDENGNWLPQIATMKVFVRPQWWQTWWAITLYALMVGGLIALGYRNILQRRRKQVIDDTIDYFANSVYGDNSVTEICWDIARNCFSQLHFEDCVVYLIDREKGKLVQQAAYGAKNPRGHEISNPIEIEIGRGIVGTVAATGKPLLIPDTSLDPRYIVDDDVRLSEIAVPILHEGRVIGVIDSEHPKRNFYKEEDMKALSTIASISSNKIAEALAEAQAQQKEIELLEINKMLAQSQLMALRAQMNPHFVFNCLNSIQECIVTQKYAEASKYLNKFARLFRMVLNNSGRNLVSLHEELEVLDLYLQLERMRFEKSFAYTITVDDDIETDEMLLPSMLVQPYVENALWHGLMHSSNHRQLDITFEMQNDDILECRIDDNGIGRRKSFELKKQTSKAKRHESKGLAISKERLEVLNRQGHHASVEITDKYTPDGIAAGTLVVIELSAFLQNS